MQNFVRSAFVSLGMAFLVLTIGCVATQPRSDSVSQLPTSTTAQSEDAGPCPAVQVQPETEVEPGGMSTDGQYISGHKVIPRWGMDKVVFSTSIPVIGGEFWAYIPDAVLACKVRIASIFWHGDDGNPKGYLRRNPNWFLKRARQIAKDSIVVYRPHSISSWTWRSRLEMRLHLALVEYLSKTFGIAKYNLYGHSGGGTIAIMVAQERPHLAATVGLAAPVLAVKARNPEVSNLWQYDPLYHIENLSPDIPVFITHDPRDRIVEPIGVDPYVKEAKKLGLKVKLVKVWSSSPQRHFTHRNLGAELRKPENRDFHPRR